jgi:hypothetical protein
VGTVGVSTDGHGRAALAARSGLMRAESAEGFESRTSGLRVRYFVLRFRADLVSNDDETCRELPFCPVAGIRGALRIPDAAGAYRGIRATMEPHRRA